jgi:hypothetical protein
MTRFSSGWKKTRSSVQWLPRWCSDMAICCPS